MTIVVVVLLGAGVLLIASALDNTPIITTFQKIISGQSIDWTGGSNSAGGTITPPPTSCPQGFTPKTVKSLDGSDKLTCVAPSGVTTCPPGYFPSGATDGSGPFYCTPTITKT